MIIYSIATIVGNIAFLFALSKLPKFPWIGLIAFPLYNYVLYFILRGEINTGSLNIISVIFLFYVWGSGSYFHPTKDGQRDRRYKYNPWRHSFNNNLRKIALWGLVGTIVLPLILGLATTKLTDMPLAPNEQQTTAPPSAINSISNSAATPANGEYQVAPLALEVPSFDCAKASNFSEKTICSNPLLGKLDNALLQNYKHMLAADIGEGARNNLISTQKNWLIERNKCTDSQCVIDIYKKRMDEVCDYPVISGIHPICIYFGDFKSS